MSPDTMIPNEGLRLVKSDRNPIPDDTVDTSETRAAHAKLHQMRLEKALAGAVQMALGEEVLVYPDHYPQKQQERVRLAARLAINAFLPAGLLDATLRARENVATITYKKDYMSLSWGQRHTIDVLVKTVWESMAASFIEATPRMDDERVKAMTEEDDE